MRQLFILFCGCILMSCGSYSYSGQTNVNNDKLISKQTCSIAVGIPYWDQNKAIESFRNNVDLIGYISVFWYNLGPEGKIRKYKFAKEDRNLINFAHKRNVKVFGLIANLPDDEQEGSGLDWDSKRVAKIISVKARRGKHIAELVKLTKRMNFDGIHIDYEALSGKYRKEFSLFIKELGHALHAAHKLLAVAIHPKTSEFNPREDNGSGAQDWDVLHRYADQLHLMTYNQHTGSDKPGPAAAPRWAEKIIRYAVNKRKIPRDKLYMGIPLYAEAWEQRSSGRYRWLKVDLTFTDVKRLMNKYKASEIWDNKQASPYITFQDKKGRRRVIWFENNHSLEKKLTLGEKYGICNIALWRLGDEDPGIWQRFRVAGSWSSE